MFIESLEKGWGIVLMAEIESEPFPYIESITTELLQHVKRK